MVDKEEVEVNLEEDILIEDIDLSDIEYCDRNLDEWEEYLTVVIPSLPCTSIQIRDCMVSLANKYQDSYNAYNKLMVLCSKSEKAYLTERDKLVYEKIKGLAKVPGKDTLESIVLAGSKKLRTLKQRDELYIAIRDFFENNKTKLEKCMNIAKDISYHVNTSDRMDSNGRVGHGS